MIELPENIASIKSFSPSQLMLLSSVQDMPAVDTSFEDETVKNIFQYYSLFPDEMDAELIRYASALLDQQKVNEAWQVLLSGNIL